MIELFHDSAFLGFCTAVFTGAFGLLRYYFVYKIKVINHKAIKDTEIINLKQDLAVQISLELKRVVDDLNPKIESLQTTVSNMAVIYSNTTDMMKRLEEKQDAFEEKTSSVSKIANDVVVGLKDFSGRLGNIETEVTELKSGNIFVRTKSETHNNKY